MRRTRTLRRALGAAAALALAASGAPGAAVTAHAARCAPVEQVWGLGRACRTAHGYDVLLRDGSVVHTHGPDTDYEGLSPYPLPPARRPACVTSAVDFRAEVVYAQPIDGIDRYRGIAGTVRRLVHEANGIVVAEAARLRRTVNLRVRCSGGVVKVTHAVLPTRRADASFETIVGDLRTLGFSDEHVKYWIWYDDFNFAQFPPGTATLFFDDSDDPTNVNNVGPDYAVTFGVMPHLGGASVMLHELAHTLGAVQASAPHSTGTEGGHCNDGQDVMCYEDGGQRANYDPNVCRGRPRFDCGYDDYFNPNPTAGYLRSHWNLAAPLNRFVQGCLYRTGSLTLGLGDLAVEGTSATTFNIPSSCRGHRFSLQGVMNSPSPTLSQKLGFLISPVLASQSALPDFDVCWYNGSASLGCTASQIGAESGTIPSRATRAQVVLAIGARSTYIFSAI